MADVSPNFDLRDADRRHRLSMQLFSIALLRKLEEEHPAIINHLQRKSQVRIKEQTA